MFNFALCPLANSRRGHLVSRVLQWGEVLQQCLCGGQRVDALPSKISLPSSVKSDPSAPKKKLVQITVLGMNFLS